MFSTPAFLESLAPLLWAARNTLLVSGLGIAFGLVIGALVCIAALSKSRLWRTLAGLWVSYLRGVPMLVQLLVVFFLLPVIGIDVPPMVAAVSTTAIVASAYISEIWRGAINALPPGQTEAAVAIGMAPRSIWTRVVLPQAVALSLPAGLVGLSIYGSPYFAEIFRSALRAVAPGQIEAARAIGMAEPAIVRRILLPLGLVSALPALVNFSIILTKETVILSIITVPELMYQTQRMSTETFRFLEANLALALFFWGLVEVISRVGRRLETRITRHLIERT